MKEVTRLLKKLFFLLPIVGIMVGFNYFIDPANLFKSTSYYEEIARVLLNGKNIARLSNFDERLVKKYYIEGLTEKKEIVVLGSSRVMLLDSDMFPEHSFFNSSVSSASLEDDIALYWMLRKKELTPHVVIIGLDPWILNKSNGNTAYKSIQKEYEEGLAYSKGSSKEKFSLPFSTKYTQLISPGYFQTSFKMWIDNLGKEKNTETFYETSDKISDNIMRRADGSINYGIKYRSAGREEVDSLAATFVRDPSMLNNFNRLDPELISNFEAFVKILKEDKVAVIFYLPPYHPVVYKSLVTSERYKTILEAQSYFEKYAQDNNIKLLGSYNPADMELGEDDFYDAMHQDLESVRAIFSHKIIEDVR